jgi:hypothetical protein
VGWSVRVTSCVPSLGSQGATTLDRVLFHISIDNLLGVATVIGLSSAVRIAVAVELMANWEPLERNLPAVLCAEFMWIYRENGVDQYKHIVTRRYLQLDRDGRCLAWRDGGWKEVPFEQEWKCVSGRAGGRAQDAPAN